MVTDVLANSITSSNIPLTGGALFGFASGYFLKKILKFIIFSLGGMVLVIGCLELQKWISVNWPVVEHQTTTIAEHVAHKAYAVTQHIGSELGAAAAGFTIGLFAGFMKG